MQWRVAVSVLGLALLALSPLRAGADGVEQLRLFVRDVQSGSSGFTQTVTSADGDKVFTSKAGLFYVTGEVKKPDSYKYQEKLTVIKAIAMAGGFTNTASKGSVRIVRKVNGKEDVLSGVDMDELVKPEDVVVVPESFF